MLPRWLSWLLFATLLYYAVTAVSRAPLPVAAPDMSPSAEAPAPASVAEKYPSLRKAADVERWKRSISPSYAASQEEEKTQANGDHTARPKR